MWHPRAALSSGRERADGGLGEPAQHLEMRRAKSDLGFSRVSAGGVLALGRGLASWPPVLLRSSVSTSTNAATIAWRRVACSPRSRRTRSSRQARN